MVLATLERAVASGASFPDHPRASKTLVLSISRLLGASRILLRAQTSWLKVPKPRIAVKPLEN